MIRQPTFGHLVVDSLAEQWGNIRTETVRKLVFVTFFWGALLLGTLMIASLLNERATVAPYLRLSTAIFLGLLTASWITISLTQSTMELNQRSSRRHLAALLAVIPTLLITALLMWSTTALTFATLKQPLHPVIASYADCVTNGGLILQTNPPQCITTTNTFTDPAGVK